MKRLLLLIASLTLIFTFTSCGDAPEDNNPYGNIDDTVRPDTSTTDKDVAKVDKDSTVGDDSDAATDDDMQNDSDETGDDDLLLDEDETTDEDESPDGGETSDYDYPPEGVVCDSSYSIKTAADITNIEHCNTITGQLVVSTYPGVDLKGLELLHTIKGEFNLFNNPNLTSLSGLENLKVVGPPTDMDLADGSYISDNPSLKSLSALQSLKQVNGWLHIQKNGAMTTVGLQKLEGAFAIQVNDNPEISSLGLPALKSTTDHFQIINNVKLTAFTTLTQLASVGGKMQITSNDILEELDGLGNLTTVDGSLFITNNPNLASTKGLSALETVHGDIHITGNNALTSLEGLEHLTTILADIHISSRALINLQGIHNITTVLGEFDLAGNNSLTTLHPQLTKLTTANILTIDNCNALTTLHGLENLTSVKTLEIAYNDELISIEALSGITTYANNVIFKSNYKLLDLAGMHNTTYIAGTLKIDNSVMENLDGFSGLQHIGGELLLYVLPRLSSLSGLAALQSVNGDFSIQQVKEVVHFNQMNALDTIGGDIHLINNEMLQAIGKFEALIGFTQDIYIERNYKLATCSVDSFLAHLEGEGWSGAKAISDTDDTAICE